jgi:predicted  nucleic acid-binding Zn-ribbon protein
MNLTITDIKKDIRAFEKRIQDAKDKLSELPGAADTLQDRQNLKGKRHILNSEIDHVERLIGIAEEALIDE